MLDALFDADSVGISFACLVIIFVIRLMKGFGRARKSLFEMLIRMLSFILAVSLIVVVCLCSTVARSVLERVLPKWTPMAVAVCLGTMPDVGPL